MTVFTIEIQLYGLCEMIRIRLGLLNDSLKRSMVYVGDGIAATEIGTKLKGIFVIYWKVVDLLELVVRTYRLQIFGGLCLTFLHLLIDVYLTMYSITESKDSSWMEALNAKPLCHFFRLTLVSMAGYGIRKQVSKTREILTLNEVAGFEDKSIRNEVINKSIKFVKQEETNVPNSNTGQW